MGACCSKTNTDVPVNNSWKDTNNSRESHVRVTSAAMQGKILQVSDLKKFQLNELKAATKGFSSDQVKGQGEFGHVFVGWIDEHSLTAAKHGMGTTVAVKKLDKMGSQGQQEWLSEIKYLGQLCHPNLVKLIGYCSEDNHRILVYEFVVNGSLDNCLFGVSRTHQLSWNQRMKIALGSAKGLAFLHEKANVIYRDFKTSNILLDSDYNARLCDFGFARDAPIDDNTHVTTRVVGTYEYLAPEYHNTGHLNTKSDVYSFGVVLLEMMSGKKAMDPHRKPEERNLVQWARQYLTNTEHPKISKLLDANLKVSSTTVSEVAKLVSRCLSEDPKFRPNMEEVVKELEFLVES